MFGRRCNSFPVLKMVLELTLYITKTKSETLAANLMETSRQKSKIHLDESFACDAPNLWNGHPECKTVPSLFSCCNLIHILNQTHPCIFYCSKWIRWSTTFYPCFTSQGYDSDLSYCLGMFCTKISDLKVWKYNYHYYSSM